MNLADGIPFFFIGYVVGEMVNRYTSMRAWNKARTETIEVVTKSVVQYIEKREAADTIMDKSVEPPEKRKIN
jgi:hypothetical protein